MEETQGGTRREKSGGERKERNKNRNKDDDNDNDDNNNDNIIIIIINNLNNSDNNNSTGPRGDHYQQCHRQHPSPQALLQRPSQERHLSVSPDARRDTPIASLAPTPAIPSSQRASSLKDSCCGRRHVLAFLPPLASPPLPIPALRLIFFPPRPLPFLLPSHLHFS